MKSNEDITLTNEDIEKLKTYVIKAAKNAISLSKYYDFYCITKDLNKTIIFEIQPKGYGKEIHERKHSRRIKSKGKDL